jgi:hypothetical protein
MRKTVLILLLGGYAISLANAGYPLPWGFFAHQIINRMAVFILPPEMMVFYKKNILFIAEHATDPDKRRYAVEGEAIKHYMDVDHWGSAPLSRLPLKWEDALAKFIEIRAIGESDSLLIKRDTINYLHTDSLMLANQSIAISTFMRFIRRHIKRNFPGNPWIFPSDSINKWLELQIDTDEYPSVECNEAFSQHGISPYNIKIQFDRLTHAFQNKNAKAILRLSADLGHYIADAHVPLHATENYNGQLTGQKGIHAFWESRLPELFAEQQYDYFVGKARYIKDVESFAWNTIIESNRLSRIVLATEASLSKNFREDQQMGYDIRLNRSIKTHTVEYSMAYHQKLDGMVEARMRAAVLALGSLWLTAWIDAGQPELGEVATIRWQPGDIRELEVMDLQYRTGNPIGRDCK